jgi:uncharacterized protein
MRIGVVGDIHGNDAGLKKAIREMGAIDLLLFTGDGFREIHRLQDELKVRIEGVAGNCDLYSTYPPEQMLSLEGYRILLTHGHFHGVKKDLIRLGMAGRDQQVHLVVFGHTHEALCTDWHEIKLFNPGSLSLERSFRGPSYGIIYLSESGIETIINRF